MASKVGRNDQCPCGSGRKFKKCHGRTSDADLEERGVGAVLDYERKVRFVVTDDILVNQLKRDASWIGASFDRFCSSEVKTMSRLMGRLTLALQGGVIKADANEDELRLTCFHLLTHALHGFIAATTILRNGFRLQPGILVRNILETLTAVICIFPTKTTGVHSRPTDSSQRARSVRLTS